MGYTVAWHIEKNILVVRYFDSVDFDDVRSSNREVDMCISDGTKPVHIVIDVLELKEYPHNVFLIRRESTYFFNPNIGNIAVLAAHPLMRMMAKVIIAISSVEFQIFSNLEDALRYFTVKR